MTSVPVEQQPSWTKCPTELIQKEFSVSSLAQHEESSGKDDSDDDDDDASEQTLFVHNYHQYQMWN